jgi:cell division protein FtsX
MFGFLGTRSWAMVRASWLYLVWVAVLISFLLFLANIFVVLTYNVHQFASTLQQQLGVYVYLQDIPGKQDEIYTQAIRLIEDLERHNISVRFYSKEEAFALLSDRLPDIIGNLEKYGISNPLPATLYVTFSSKEQFDTVSAFVGQYSGIITNINDLTSTKSFDHQEQRIAYILSLARVVSWITSFLVVVIIGIIVAFLLSMTYTQVQRYSAQIEIEKLLWAPYWFMLKPFLIVVTFVFLAGYLVHAFYFLSLRWYIGGYMNYVFGSWVLWLLLPSHIGWLVVGQLLLLLLLVWGMVYGWLRAYIFKH